MPMSSSPRVPAPQYAQRLRDAGAPVVLCDVDMETGHFSKSGRFDRLKQVSLEYAFFLRALGMEHVKPRQ